MPKVLLTGAAGGIGQATARLLSEKGFSLILTDISLEVLEKAFPSPPPQAELYAHSVTDLSAWEALAERYPDIDILIQLAGILRVANFIHQPIEEWHLQQSVNLTGLVYGAWVYGRKFVERGHGHIINIASMAGIAPVPGLAGYSATKFGVRGFSLALDMELRPKGVPVTVICPGPVATPMIFNELPKPESVYTLVAGGLLTPDAVARAIWRAIRRRPREILIPRNKAILARMVSLLPFTLGIAPRLLERGAARRRLFYLQSQPFERKSP